MHPHVHSLSRRAEHALDKQPVERVRLLAGLGVEGDVHAGRTVTHRSRVRADPTQPNLRQVHLIQAELLDELAAAGFDVAPGRLGENVLTRGIDLLALPTGARLELGDQAVIELTGLRNPCAQLNQVGEGLMQSLATRRTDGSLLRRAGVMAIVLCSGDVREGDEIRVRLTPGPRLPLAVV